MFLNNNNIGLRPKQSICTHIVLGMCTMGIGNIWYGVHVARKQKQWDATVQALNTTTNNNFNR